MSENKSPIPSRLYNAAKGGHVAGTADIIDDDKGKTQDVVNKEIDSALENRYTKEETYSKTELNNLITTPNQEYISVVATDQTTSVTDVLPATGAADTTYRVGNWDGTQYDDSVFSEYAWNGSAYIKLSTKSQIGEVYNISANHAGATYANLSAALGTNGANIPQLLRKGGMEIKYIDSNDNYYKKYRSKTQSFTTDVNDWCFESEEILVENVEFIKALTDKKGRIILAIKPDGTVYYGSSIPPQIKEYVGERYYEESNEFVYVIIDNNNNVICGIKTDGSFDWQKGIPLHLQKYIEESITNALVTNKRQKYLSKAELNANRIISAVSASSYIYEMPLDTTKEIDIYVSSLGNDGNTDISLPFKTISGALNYCETNYNNKKIQVIIQDDYVLEEEEVINSINNNNYIINAEDRIITSLKSITNYSITDDVVTIPKPSSCETIESLYINGIKRNIAKNFSEDEIADMPFFKKTSTPLVIKQDDQPDYTYKLQPNNLIVTPFEVGSFIKIYSEWVCTIAKVVEVGDNYLVIHTDSDLHSLMFKTPYPNTAYPEHKYACLNSSKVVEKGTYWFDDENIYYKLNDNEVVNTVHVANSTNLIKVKNSSNIIFKNVVFKGTNSLSLCSINHQGESERNSAVIVYNSTNIHFYECEFTDIADNCLRIYKESHYCSIQKCYFHDIGCGGIVGNSSYYEWETPEWRDNTSHLFIYSNIIRGFGRVNSSGVGVIISVGNNVTILSNYIFDGYYDGISYGWRNDPIFRQYCHNVLICNNVVHHVMQFVMCDGGGIYLQGIHGGLIDHNTVYCVNTRSRKDCAIGIYHDAGNSMILNYGNTICCCDVGHSSSEVLVINNKYLCITDEILYIPSENQKTCIISCLLNGESLKQISDYAMVRDCVRYGFINGLTYVVKQDETFNKYNWGDKAPIYENFQNNDFKVLNADELYGIGYETIVEELVTYTDIPIPVFINAKYESYLTLSNAFLEEYKQKYKEMSFAYSNGVYNAYLDV